jgi:hypothetical protein
MFISPFQIFLTQANPFPEIASWCDRPSGVGLGFRFTINNTI